MRGYSFTGSGSPRGGWVRNEPVLNLEGPGCGKVRWFTKADFRGAVEMLKALQRGEMVLGFADGVLGRSKDALEHYGHRSARHNAATAEVMFLGRRVSANTGMAWYHLQSGAAVLPIKILRKQGAKLQVVVEPALDLSGKHDLESVAATIYRALEKDVNFHPAQWAYWDRLQQLEISPVSVPFGVGA
jgi:lauroyl/myristoyl acyltransferase